MEKEEVKDADDNVTSSTEKTTETVKIDGGTLVSEKTEVTDATGNVTTTENIKAESNDNTILYIGIVVGAIIVIAVVAVFLRKH